MTTETTTPDLIEEVETLLAKATPRPWEQSQLAGAYVISMAHGHVVVCAFAEYEKDGTLDNEFENAENNMALVLRGPELLCRLAEEVKRLRAVSTPAGKSDVFSEEYAALGHDERDSDD